MRIYEGAVRDGYCGVYGAGEAVSHDSSWDGLMEFFTGRLVED
jgi:hypothetical protein